MNRKFEVGKIYACVDLYSGTVHNKCVSRTETTVTFIESDMFSKMDDVAREPSTYEVRHDANGNEECLVYHSEKYDYDSVIRADMPDGFNSLDWLEKQEEKQENKEECDCEYCPSSTNGDYSPSSPWDAPGMSIRDFM